MMGGSLTGDTLYSGYQWMITFVCSWTVQENGLSLTSVFPFMQGLLIAALISFGTRNIDNTACYRIPIGLQVSVPCYATGSSPRSLPNDLDANCLLPTI